MLDPLFKKLTHELKRGLPFPDDHQEDDPRTAVFQLLFGALMGLAKAKELIDEADDDLSAVICTPNLVDDLLGTQHGSSSWAGTDSLRAWSIGYFIGKSAANISASLDRAVNIWLSSELYGTLPGPGQRRDDIFYSYIVARIRCVEVIAPRHRAVLEPIRRHMSSELIDTEHAYDEILNPKQVWPSSPDPSICTTTSVSDLEAIAVAIMWARHNAFKHQARHYPRFVPSDLTGEWSMAVLGLCAIIKVAGALHV